MPAWWKTPAEAKRSTTQGPIQPPSATPSRIRPLVTKPFRNGKPEMEAAPTMQKAVVRGMDLYRPPSSEPLMVPVRSSTAPMAMNSRPSKMMLTKAYATAPLTAMAVPMPMPATMKPSWLFRE